MTKDKTPEYIGDRREQPLAPWEKPLSMPRPAPKPEGGKKKRVAKGKNTVQ